MVEFKSQLIAKDVAFFGLWKEEEKEEEGMSGLVLWAFIPLLTLEPLSRGRMVLCVNRAYCAFATVWE